MEFKSYCCAIICAVFKVLTIQAVADPAEYKAIEIADKGGYQYKPEKINNAGQVIGIYRLRNGFSVHGFLYSNHHIEDLGTVWPVDINDSGDVVMWWIGDHGTLPSGTALLYSNGRFTNVTELISLRSNAVAAVTVRAINNSGVIVGACRLYDPYGDDHPFIYSNGVLTVLGKVPFHQFHEAYRINNLGQVTDWASDGTSALYEGTNRVLVGITPQSFAAIALGINDSGQIVGGTLLQVPDNPWRPFIWQNHVTTILDTLPGLPAGVLNDVNTFGVAVGSCVAINGDYRTSRAIIHKNGVAQDLNGLVKEKDNDLVYLESKSINDAGWIVVTAIHGGEDAYDADPHAVLLQPHPPGRNR